MVSVVDNCSPGNISLLRPNLQIEAVGVCEGLHWQSPGRACDIDKDLKTLLYGFHRLP